MVNVFAGEQKSAHPGSGPQSRLSGSPFYLLAEGLLWDRLRQLDSGPSNGRHRVRRETGKELMVRVHYDEGVAIHIGPESCAGRS